MQKSYNRINWENYPSDKTPVNEENLNKIDSSLDEIDNRVITLDTTKATKVEVSTLFKEAAFDEQTGIITFTRKNGAVVTIDTPMEKIQTGIYYNPGTEKLVLPLIDGTEMEVDLSRLMKFDEFIDSDTIAFSVKANGIVTAIVKEGSIQEKHLQPNYLADIKLESAKAQASQQAAATSEANTKASEAAAKESETAAKTSETVAAISAESAAASANTASAKATAAANSAAEAAAYADNAKTSETNAKTSETNASGSKTAAATSATNAVASATTAGTKATEALNYATQSQSYAVGGTGTRTGEDSDNAKYYYEQSREISERLAGALMLQSRVDTIEEIFIVNGSAQAHNSIFRGKDLTNIYSIEQLHIKVAAGDFTDLFIGDYIEVLITTSYGGLEKVRLRIAAFDYFLNNGSVVNVMTMHHLVLVPEDSFKTSAQMNTESNPTGAYVYTNMHTTILPAYFTALQSALQGRLITHNRRLSSSVSETTNSAAGMGYIGASVNSIWTDVGLCLMSEPMVYGCMVYSSSPHDVMDANSILPLFNLAPNMRRCYRGYESTKRSTYWLNALVSTSHYANVSSYGHTSFQTETYPCDVRPYMLFG